MGSHEGLQNVLSIPHDIYRVKIASKIGPESSMDSLKISQKNGT